MSSALDIVNRFYATTDRHDADGIADLVIENMIFVGPLMSSDTREAYVEINRQLLSHHAATRMKRQFVLGDDVCSIYEMDIVAPDGSEFTADFADWISTNEGKITSQRIYYDPRRFAEAFAI